MRQGEYHFAYLVLWIFIMFCCVFYHLYRYLIFISSFISSCVLFFCLWSIFCSVAIIFTSLSKPLCNCRGLKIANKSQSGAAFANGGHPGEQAACRKTYWYYLFIPNGRCTRVTFGYGTVRCEQAGWAQKSFFRGEQVQNASSSSCLDPLDLTRGCGVTMKPRDSRQNRFLRDARCQHRADLRVNINI